MPNQNAPDDHDGVPDTEVKRTIGHGARTLTLSVTASPPRPLPKSRKSDKRLLSPNSVGDDSKYPAKARKPPGPPVVAASRAGPPHAKEAESGSKGEQSKGDEAAQEAQKNSKRDQPGDGPEKPESQEPKKKKVN